MIKRIFLSIAVIFSLFVGYNLFLKRTRILTKELKSSFVDLGGEAKEIRFPHRFVKATNPGVVKFKEGYLMIFRTKYRSLSDFLIKKMTMRQNNPLGLCRLNKDLEVVSEPIYMNGSTPAVNINKQSPNDPRLIEHQGRFWAFYNDRVYLDGVGYVRKMCMCEVFPDHFGIPKILTFPESHTFTEKGKKFHHVEKNWTPFIYQGGIYMIYLIEPHVILKLDLDTGVCHLVSESPSGKIWDFGIARGGTPCIEDKDGYMTFFHSLYPVTGLGHAHNNAYLLGAYWFSGQPPFEIIKRTTKPLSSPSFYAGFKKIVYPTSLVDEGDHLLLFYGRDDQEIWALRVSKEQLNALGECK